MNLKEKIQSDFIKAMKAKDENAKAALSGIKAKITEAEKANGNKELTDDEIIKVITKAIKQREESQKIYEDSGRSEMAQKESEEANILRGYMPAKMNEEEIKKELVSILEHILQIEGDNPNQARLSGRAIGEFNKRFQGRADVSEVKKIIEKYFQN